MVDQDLNEEAGSFWNKLGDEAVYMGIKRTDDEKNATGVIILSVIRIETVYFRMV